MTFTIGADIGGTKLSAILVDGDGAVHREAWTHHSVQGVRDIMAAFDDVFAQLGVDDLVSEGRIDGFGLSFAGWLSLDRETVMTGANLGMTDVPLRALLSERLGGKIPVAIENDGDATLWGEYTAGAARGARSAVLVTIGTGVGGGIVLDGVLVRGAHGLGGELGHMPLFVDSDVLCVCGGFGHLETAISGRTLGQQATALRAADPEGWLATHHPGDTALSARELGAAARAGDAAALAVLTETAGSLGTALHRLIPVVDPDVIVLGGSVSDGLSDLLIPRVERVLAEDPFVPSLLAPPRVVRAALGPKAAAIGAAHFLRSA